VMAGEHGVIVRPRWETGTGRGTVVGYSVARPSVPGSGEDLVWFGGGKLGKDLTLPALRAGWATDPGAVAAWRAVDAPSSATRTPAAARPHPGLTAGGDTQEVAAARAVHQVREALRAVPVGDAQAWSAAARDGAGVLAAAAQGRTGGTWGRVGQAAHALAGAVEKTPGRHVQPSVGEGGLQSAARAMLSVAAATTEGAGTAVLLTQVLRLSETIAAAHAQAGRLVLARAAAAAAERNTAALARVGGPVELGPTPTRTPEPVVARDPALAWAIEQANRTARSPLRPGRALRDQPVPPARKDTGRDNERGMGS
jgi:hypothetical protein